MVWMVPLRLPIILVIANGRSPLSGLALREFNTCKDQRSAGTFENAWRFERGVVPGRTKPRPGGMPDRLLQVSV